MKARNLASKYPHMKEHERAAVVLYTIEDYPRENSPYFVMNRALRNKNRIAVRPWRDFIWLLMHGIRKIPEPTETRELIRGCKSSLKNWGDEFKVGHTFQWAAFSSTARKIEVMKEFLGTAGERTLFQIKLLSPSYGRSLQDFSFFPDESEVLLAPGCTFTLTSMCDLGHGLTIVQCEQVASADQILDISTSTKPTNANTDPAPKKEAKPVKAQPQPPISSDWTNVLQHVVKGELEALHQQLFGTLGSSKSKQELVDAVCAHSSGIGILKRVPVDALRGVLEQKAGMSRQEAKALSKEDIVEKFRRGELRVPARAKPIGAPAEPQSGSQPMPDSLPTPVTAAPMPKETLIGASASAPPLQSQPHAAAQLATAKAGVGMKDGSGADESSDGKDAITGKDGPKAKKAKKDPNAPKKPGNGFNLFCEAERANVRTQALSAARLR
jgi:hypothetical protein